MLDLTQELPQATELNLVSKTDTTKLYKAYGSIFIELRGTWSGTYSTLEFYSSDEAGENLEIIKGSRKDFETLAEAEAYILERS